MKKKKTGRKQNKRGMNEKRLLAYTAAAGAALAVAAPADATINYTSQVINLSNSNTLIDINTDGQNDFWFDHQLTAASSATFGRILSIGSANASWLGNNRSVASLSNGELVATATGAQWTVGGNRGHQYLFGLESGSWMFGEFTSGNTGYIGVRFNPGAGNLYGWIHVSSIAADYSSYQIDGWAYDDSGASIKAGQMPSVVPEPSSTALFAAGAAGMVAFRKRKKKK